MNILGCYYARSYRIFQIKHTRYRLTSNRQYDEVGKKNTKCIETIPVPSSVGAEVFMTVL